MQHLCCESLSVLSFCVQHLVDQWDSRVAAAEYCSKVCVVVTLTLHQTSVAADELQHSLLDSEATSSFTTWFRSLTRYPKFGQGDLTTWTKIGGEHRQKTNERRNSVARRTILLGFKTCWRKTHIEDDQALILSSRDSYWYLVGAGVQ